MSVSLCASGQTIYEWDQTVDEVNIYIPLPPGVPSKAIQCTLSAQRIVVGIKGNPPYMDVSYPLTPLAFCASDPPNGSFCTEKLQHDVTPSCWWQYGLPCAAPFVVKVKSSSHCGPAHASALASAADLQHDLGGRILVEDSFWTIGVELPLTS